MLEAAAEEQERRDPLGEQLRQLMQWRQRFEEEQLRHYTKLEGRHLAFIMEERNERMDIQTEREGQQNRHAVQRLQLQQDKQHYLQGLQEEHVLQQRWQQLNNELEDLQQDNQLQEEIEQEIRRLRQLVQPVEENQEE